MLTLKSFPVGTALLGNRRAKRTHCFGGRIGNFWRFCELLLYVSCLFSKSKRVPFGHNRLVFMMVRQKGGRGWGYQATAGAGGRNGGDRCGGGLTCNHYAPLGCNYLQSRPGRVQSMLAGGRV